MGLASNGGSVHHRHGFGAALGMAHHAAHAFVSQPLAVGCALGAAFLYGLASVLQHRGASSVPASQSMRPGLLARLVRDPVWLAGVGADVGGYVLQFVAVAVGTLVLVQPLLVCGLLFALPIGARLYGSRLARSDWLAAAAVCVGLAGFQVVAAPAPGHAYISTGAWLVLLVGGVGVGLVLAAAGHVRVGRAKVVLLAASAGTVYGLAAALTKTTGALIGDHGVGVLAHWQPYALIILGAAGMLVSQSAFQAGPLDLSLPTLTVVDPVVSILIGALAFGETITGGAGAVTAEVLSLALMVLGIYSLSRSPAVSGPRPPVETASA